MEPNSGQENFRATANSTYCTLLGFAIVTSTIFGAAYAINAVISILASGYCKHDEAFWAALSLCFGIIFGAYLHKKTGSNPRFYSEFNSYFRTSCSLFIFVNSTPSEYFRTKTITDTSKDFIYGWPVPFSSNMAVTEVGAWHRHALPLMLYFLLLWQVCIF